MEFGVNRAGVTDGVAQFADVGRAEYVFSAQQVGHEAADDHDKPHDKVRQSRQSAVLPMYHTAVTLAHRRVRKPVVPC